MLDEITSNQFWEHFKLAKLAILNKKHFAFIGSMLYKLKVEPDISIKDVFLDGIYSTIKVNPSWFLSLNPEESASMLAHEVMHYALQHDIRRGKRNPALYQKAADHVVNNILMDFGFKLPTNIEVDRRFQNQTTDLVYKQVLMDYKNEEPDYDNTPGSNDLPSDNFDISNNVQNQRNRDIQQSELADKATGSPGIANSCEAFQQLFTDINQGKLNWKVLLAEHFNELTQGEYSYHDFDRRMLSLGYYLPIKESLGSVKRVAVALDVSSSVSEDQIKFFLKEIKAILLQLNPEIISVMTFNTGIVDVFEFKQDDDLSPIKIKIGGGTSFKPVFNHYNQKENIPQFLIIFSDLEVHWNNITEPKYSTTFICLDNPEEQAPFGKTIHINSENLEC